MKITLCDWHMITSVRAYFLSLDARYAHLDDAGRWYEAERQVRAEWP